MNVIFQLPALGPRDPFLDASGCVHILIRRYVEGVGQNGGFLTQIITQRPYFFRSIAHELVRLGSKFTLGVKIAKIYLRISHKLTFKMRQFLDALQQLDPFIDARIWAPDQNIDARLGHGETRKRRCY